MERELNPSLEKYKIAIYAWELCVYVFVCVFVCVCVYVYAHHSFDIYRKVSGRRSKSVENIVRGELSFMYHTCHTTIQLFYGYMIKHISITLAC